MEIQYTTAESFVQMKLQRNAIMNIFLIVEDKLLKAEMVMRLRLLEFNQKRKSWVAELDKIENTQLKNYSLEKESIVTEITTKINTHPNIEELQKEINELRKKYQTYLKQIQDINSKIPSKIPIVNWRIVPRLDSCHSAAKKII
jgi:hypothetical protein